MKTATVAAEMHDEPGAENIRRGTLDALREIFAPILSTLETAGRMALMVLRKLILNRLQKLAEKVHYA